MTEPIGDGLVLPFTRAAQPGSSGPVGRLSPDSTCVAAPQACKSAISSADTRARGAAAQVGASVGLSRHARCGRPQTMDPS
jgi:hypothetical protein